MTFRSGDYNSAIGNLWDGKGTDNTEGIRIFGKHHMISKNWFMEVTEMAVSVEAGEDSHVAAENITIESNTMEDRNDALKLGASYDEAPQEPILFNNNVVSNDQDLKMIKKYSPKCDYDFSQGNYFFGSNLGWDGDLPEGLIWDKNTMDLGTEGHELLQSIKCKAGPSWEQTC